MAIITDKVLSVEDVGFVAIIYDDTLRVGDNILNCDLDSVRVVVEAGRTAKFTITESGQVVWREASNTGPTDVSFVAVGIPKVGDLAGWVFGGDE